MPGCHAPPPPVFQLSLPHDALTFGSLASIGWCSQIVLPVSASTAKMRADDRPFAALRADDDHVLDRERRAGEADGQLLRIDQLRVPDLLAGPHVERDQPAVDGADIDLAARDRDAAIVGAVRLFRDQRFVELGEVIPLHLAGGAVEREHAAVRAGVIEHAVDRQRHRLQAPLRAARRVHPRHVQVLDVLGVDLR